MPGACPCTFMPRPGRTGQRSTVFSEVVGISHTAGTVTGISVFDHRHHRQYHVAGDVVVNAAGPWAGKISGLAGVALPIRPGPGIMVAVNARITHMVINRLQRPGEGDIIVPQRRLSILGTSLWLAEDPDAVDLPEAHIGKMVDRCAEMVPSVRQFPVHAAWCAARPLIADDDAESLQAISRSFICHDHGPVDNIEGLISVIGGKATTLRAMAEKTADLICRKLGRDIPCTTRAHRLLHYRHFYRGMGK